MEDFALAASGEQEEADDIGLLPGAGSFVGVFIEDLMQAPEFVPGQEAGEQATTVGLDATCRGGIDVVADYSEVQDTAKDIERGVGAARCGLTVGVEPAQHLLAGDVMERR